LAAAEGYLMAAGDGNLTAAGENARESTFLHLVIDKCLQIVYLYIREREFRYRRSRRGRL
jgi:hypothetical protein